MVNRIAGRLVFCLRNVARQSPPWISVETTELRNWLADDAHCDGTGRNAIEDWMA